MGWGIAWIEYDGFKDFYGPFDSKVEAEMSRHEMDADLRKDGLELRVIEISPPVEYAMRGVRRVSEEKDAFAKWEATLSQQQWPLDGLDDEFGLEED